MIARLNLTEFILGGVLLLGCLPQFSQDCFAGSTDNVELTATEKAWIATHPKITFGIDEDWAPLIIRNPDGTFTGIDGDTVRRLNEILGTHISFVTGKWSMLVAQLKNKEIDGVSSSAVHDERRDFANFTDSYTSYKKYIYIRNSNPENIYTAADLNGKRVIYQKGNLFDQKALNLYTGVIAIPKVSDQQKVEAVLAGEADGFIGGITTDYFLQKSGIIHFKPVLVLEGNLDLVFSIRKDWPELVSILNKGLKNIPASERLQTKNRYLSDLIKQLDSSYAAEKIQDSSQLNIILALTVLTLSIFIGLVVLMARASREEMLSRRFGSRGFRRSVITAEAVLAIVIVILAWWALEYNRRQLAASRQAELETILQTTRERLYAWVETQKLLLKGQAEHSEIAVIVERLLAVTPDADSLRKSPELSAARNFHRKHFNFLTTRGFFIINPARISIGSMRDSNLGVVNLIAAQRPDLLDRVFHGETVFIPPIQSDVPLGMIHNNAAALEPTIFVATPIYNRHRKVIAVLAVRLDPAQQFSQVFNFGRIGSSGESYAFDKTGRLLSNSRFNDELIQIGLIRPGQSSPLNILLKDPGGNLVDGYRSPLPRDALPLTRMAASAVSGVSGVDMVGYRDYRGVSVVGTWFWDNTLNLGMATEIDLNEAFAAYYIMRWTVLGLLGMVLSIAIGGTMFTLFLGERASRVLRFSRDELEEKVHERTIDLEKEIQDRKEAEQMLQEQKQKLSGLYELSPLGIALTDMQGAYLDFNESFRAICGYTADELKYLDCWTLTPEEYSVQEAAQLEVLNATGRYGPYEKEYRRKDGSRIPIRLNGVLVKGKNGQTFIWSIVEDITKQKQYEAELKLARDAADSANQAKSQFLSSMSHELRTPLNAILGFAQLFEYKKELSPDLQDNAKEIFKAGKHLLFLVNEVLDLARIESGDLQLSLDAVALAEILSECHKIITPLAISSGIALDFRNHQCDSLYIKGDYTRLKQVFLNLLSNAVKYNRQNGRVSLECFIKENDIVRIHVSDTGMGISADKLKNLFQPFNRLGAEFGSIEGTGIGLVITKELVEMMDGTIGVNSVSGEGTTFWIDFKLATPPLAAGHGPGDAKITVAESARLQNIKSHAVILIAEDNVSNQTVLQQQMAVLGFRADIVENGAKAWELITNGNYDLLLTDIHMPQMDGYELTDRIREAERASGKHLPIIALTANAMSVDEKRCMEHGMDAYISKPVSIDVLQSVLEIWLLAK